MKKNIGNSDAYIRFMVGVCFLINIVILQPASAGTVVLTTVGIALIYTAFSRYCPLYVPINFCTCDSSEGENCCKCE